MRWAGKSYWIRLHLKSGSSKASDGARHMQGRGDQQPPFTGLWFEQRGGVQCVLKSGPWPAFHVNSRRVAAETSKSFERGRAKPAEDDTRVWVVPAEPFRRINPH